MACGIYNLPPELVFIILRNAPDLESLYQFVCTSKWACWVFEGDSVGIVNEVIRRTIPGFASAARIVALFGSLNSNPSSSFRSSLRTINVNELVATYTRLQGGNPKQAPPLWPSLAETPGPRYLLLSAYRIRCLRGICLSILLQNAHETPYLGSEAQEMESKAGSARKGRVIGLPSCRSAGWPPSQGEKYRVQGTLWNLMVYWSFRLANEAEPDILRRAQYHQVEKCVGPAVWPQTGNRERRLEVCRMECVSLAVQSFLDCSPSEFFATYSGETRRTQVQASFSRFWRHHNRTTPLESKTLVTNTANLDFAWDQDLRPGRAVHNFGQEFLEYSDVKDEKSSPEVTYLFSTKHLYRIGYHFLDSDRLAWLILGDETLPGQAGSTPSCRWWW